MTRLVRNLINRFRADSAGAATVEFVIIAPVFFAIVLSVFEAGWLMTKFMMLERGLDLTVRDLRLGSVPNPTHDTIKAKLCEHAVIFADCQNVVLIELTPVQMGTGSFPTNSRTCVDRTATVSPVVNYDTGSRWNHINPEIMFVRACVIVDPIFPGNRLGLQLSQDASGGFQMSAFSAFANEPL